MARLLPYLLVLVVTVMIFSADGSPYPETQGTDLNAEEQRYYGGRRGGGGYYGGGRGYGGGYRGYGGGYRGGYRRGWGK